MIKSIHDALWEWFSQCAHITKLFFNFSTANDGDTMISNAGDIMIEEYLDGSQKRRYSFELIRFLPLTVLENDPSNVAMMEDVDAIIQWIEDQTEADNLPKLPEGYSVESIVNLDTYTGVIAAQDESMAKYMIPFAMDYMKG